MKKKKLPSLIVLMILTLITTVFWISFSIYRVFSDDPAPVVPEEVISQIDPKFDVDTIEKMKIKIFP